MWFVKEVGLFLAAFYGMFIAGYIHPYLGFAMLLLFVVYFCPRQWKATVLWKTDRQIAAKKRNIRTQMMAGRQDARLIREVADEFRSE